MRPTDAIPRINAALDGHYAIEREVGVLLFYVRPFVQGETLRARVGG